MTTNRAAFRRRLESGAPVFAPLALEPISARLIERLGYEAAYLSGGALGFSLSVSEALLTLTELTTATRQITQRSSIPLIVDGGVGFGDPLHASRMVWEFEAAGAAAVELEDQIAPKRAHHHKGVEHLISKLAMVEKIAAAAEARRDPDFLIIARTGAVRNESFDAAIDRGHAYLDAGADLFMIFADDEQLRRAAALIDAPLATMTAFGGRSKAGWAELGYALVIDPFSGQVLAYQAMRDAYRGFLESDQPGHEADVFALYRELQEEAGMAALYEIEAKTTEKDAP